MEFEELEVKLQLRRGQISEVERRKGRLYRKIIVFRRQASWKPRVGAKMRSISCPCPELKVVQRQIYRLISAHFEPHPIAHAYVKGRGIVSNANQHVRKEWLFHVDLVDFFGSISDRLVRDALRRLLPHYSDNDIISITDLCCHKGFLPQGSPASPILSNLVCRRLDERLQQFAWSRGLTVTRYSDDICFSSTNAAFSDELATLRGRGATQQISLGAPLRSLFDLHGFEINRKKLRFQDRSERQQVNGLIVNERVKVPSEYYQEVRCALHLWEKRGIDWAAFQCRPSWSAKRFASSLKGMIDYIGQVTGGRDQQYQVFLLTFKELIGHEVA